MSNIVGTIISVERFLKNQKSEVFILQTDCEEPYIVLEENREYVIPDYQREVRWKKENIIELISDINDGERFLGNIILSKKRNLKYEIIDGQQRLTMLLMLLKYVKYISGNSIDMYPICLFKIESFLNFQKLLDSYFNLNSLSSQENHDIVNSDIFNQRNRYYELWESIGKSGIITSGNSRSFFTKLSRCELNILLNTAIDGGYSIQYFLDVNLKGVRLDTEDILKSYLFSYDPYSSEIKEYWNDSKKKIFKIEKYTSKYTLIKVVEQFLHCDLYTQEDYENSGIKFNEKFLLKSPKIVKDAPFHKNDHIVKVINNNNYFRQSFNYINKYLDIYIDIISTDGVSAEFRNMFTIDGKRILQDIEIKVIHNLLKKIMLDENVVPKILVMKYLLDTFILNDKPSRSDFKKIYGVYCLAILFTIFDDKRSSSQITNIVEMEDWNSGIILQINKYLNSELSAKRLAAKYSVILLAPVENTLDSDNDCNELEDSVSLHKYQYRCKSLATIYNYFRINHDSVSITNLEAVYTYLNDERLFNIEHFILNKSETYKIPGIDTDIQYPDEIKKYAHSLFNFIFMGRSVNGSLGNMHIRDKLQSLMNDSVTMTCDYSQMIYEICQEFFLNTPNIDGLVNPNDIEEAYTKYYQSNFISDYTNFVAKVITKVVNKIKNN
jgi:hypothetical protein